MPLQQNGEIRYYQFPTLQNQGIYHAIFTRHGGLSPAPWESLNFGSSVGDDAERVRINREKALRSLEIDPEGVYDVYQVHSSDIVMTARPRAMGETHIKADGIITNTPHLTLLMRFADCVPIFLVDPEKHAIGIVHAGWAGTVHKIASKAVEMMRQKFGSNPKDVYAAIGPSIGPDHYQVRNDVIAEVKVNFDRNASRLINTHHGMTYLDLWKANQLVLNEAGVSQVEIAGICTCCNPADWYSHRGEHGKTGRFGAVIGLN